MRMAGYMRGRMQYAPTWVRSISTEKEHYPCGWLGICRGVCFCAPTGLGLTSTEKEYYPCGWPDTFWGICNMLLPVYDQLLPRKNTTHVNGRVCTGAYAIRPYRLHNRYARKGMITVHAKRFRFRFPILVRACKTVQVSFPDFSPCMRNDSVFVFRFLIRTGNR